ncbi:MAG: ATP-binding protein [Deltaproteobacteria bacterium]|nr:ATP-binding protein [Deltaproteobacteria bacterium]
MVERPFWIGLLLEALKKRPIVWLAGVRRSGKTSLCRMLSGVRYFDCELPSVRREVESESFWEGQKKQTVILDEIHRLSHPAEILKIAADHYPSIHVIATGSSTLAATTKFRDSLTGRKTRIWLTPANSLDSQVFGIGDFKKRLLLGGLPPFLLADQWDESAYQEWLDSFWSRDIQELFRLGNRSSFLKFFELLMAQSGGIFEAQKFASPCEVSRPTISNYLAVLETTLTAHVIRPYSKRLATEIVTAPKVFGFDTGFVSFAKGWTTLPNDHAGLLFEHWVLNEFHSVLQETSLNYWRDKAGHEIDFVWKRRGKPPVAIECKWHQDQFDDSSLRSFRHRHPEGENILITANQPGKRLIKKGPLEIIHLGPESVRDWIQSKY